MEAISKTLACMSFRPERLLCAAQWRDQHEAIRHETLARTFMHITGLKRRQMLDVLIFVVARPDAILHDAEADIVAAAPFN